MLHIILLSTLAIISKSMVTSHQKCGISYIFDPVNEACCNERKYIYGIQSCCNGIVFDSPSCTTGTTPSGKPLPVQLPNGPKLIIRSDYVKPVDADVDITDEETDTTDEETETADDGGSDTADGADETETETADDGGSDTDDDDADDANAENDEDNDDGDDNDGDDNDGDDDDDDDNYVDGVEGSPDEDETETETGSAEPGSETQTGSDGVDVEDLNALYNQNGELESGSPNNNSNNFNDMDYYVKITLINMWLILGLIVIVNIIFYWCYCRKQNQRNKMNRIQSSHMYVDEHITQGQLTDDDNDDNV